MSLITDNDYFLQALRLAFLRLETPLAASSTAHLVQSTPGYALSTYALHAGLAAETQLDFGLSRSPGEIPTTSSSGNAADGLLSGRRPDRSANARNRERNEPNAGGAAGASGLRHSETIVGRHGAKSASSAGQGPGTRVKGKRSSWKPKPHHLEAARQADPASFGTSASTQQQGRTALPNLIIASPDGTARPSLRSSALADSGSEGEDSNDEGEDADPLALHKPAPDDNAHSLFRKSRHLLNLDTRSLSEILDQQQSAQDSPTDSMASRRDAIYRPSAMSDDGETETSASMTSSRATKQEATTNRQLAFGPALEDGLEDSEEDMAEINTSDEEDDFVFSLHDRDGVSSFDSSVQSLDPRRGLQGSLIEASQLATSASLSQLPSIAEAAENGLDLVDSETDNLVLSETGQAQTGVNNDDDPATAALKAAQTARRRARRRVNISGRVPLNIDIPISPELTGPTQNGSPVYTSPGKSARSKPGSPKPPISPTGSAGSQNASRPMSPSSPLASNLPFPRSKSATQLRTRQRSKTEPGPLSASLRMSPRTMASGPSSPLSRESDLPPLLRRERSEGSSITITAGRQPRIHDLSTSPSPGMKSLQTRQSRPSMLSNGSLTSSPVSAPDLLSPEYTGSPQRDGANEEEEENDGNMTEPVKPLNLRSKSAQAALETAKQSLSSPHPPMPIPPSEVLTSQNTATDSISVADTSSRSASKQPHVSKNTDPYISFPISRQPVLPFLAPKQSALSLMLRAEETGSSGGSTNPFNEFYGALFAPAAPSAPAGRFARRGGATKSESEFTIYYPFSKDRGKPLKINLKPDLVVEEIIGAALWKYWAEDRMPSLCPNAKGENDNDWEEKDEEAKKKLAVSNWTLRIADEDEDGEVDDDFPAPDRTRPAKGFGTCFAVVEATPAQAKQNLASDSQIQRRPSRIMKKIEKQKASASAVVAAGTLAPPPTAHILPLGGGAPTAASIYSGSFTGTPSKASFSMAGSTAPMVYLRIRIPLKGPEAITTTVQVPSDMYLADVVELTCRKKFLENPKDWIFTLPDKGIVVPLDRTVESLQGMHHLALQRKNTVLNTTASTNQARAKLAGLHNTNPNASIFKRLSEPPQPKYVSSADLNTNYRSYLVQRKMPMPLGRHERILSLDNDYIHIMPSDTKLNSATVRTASYHVSQVASCKTSRRAPSTFKLVVWREKDKDVKRYDFEVASSKMAVEIVQTIQALMQAYRESMDVDAKG